MRALPLILALLIAFPLLGTLALLPFNQGVWWDEAVYLGLANGLAQGRYSLDPVFPADSFRPPLLPLLLLPFRADPLLARLATLGTALLAIAATALLAERIKKGAQPGPRGSWTQASEPASGWSRGTGGHVGLWAAALLATASSFVFFSSKAFSEPLFIALAALSILAVHQAAPLAGRGRSSSRLFRPAGRCRPGFRWGEGSLWLFLAGLLAGFAVLTRYFGLLLLLAELLLLLRWRWNPLPWIAGAGLLLIPWIILTAPVYGLPSGAIGANLKVYATTANPDISGTGLATAGLAGLLAIGGLALLAQQRLGRPERDPQGNREPHYRPRAASWFCAVNPAASLTALLAILAAASFLLLPNKEPRYLLSFLGAFAALGGLAAAWAADRSRLLGAALCILLLLSALAGLGQQWQDRTAASALREANAFLGPRTSPDEVILTTSPPYLSLANRRGLGLCGPYPQEGGTEALPPSGGQLFPSLPGYSPPEDALAAFTQCNRELAAGIWDPLQLELLRQRFGARWLVLYRFEPTAPLYLASSAEYEGAIKRAAFAQWGDPEAVLVYELPLASGG